MVNPTAPKKLLVNFPGFLRCRSHVMFAVAWSTKGQHTTIFIGNGIHSLILFYNFKVQWSLISIPDRGFVRYRISLGFLHLMTLSAEESHWNSYFLRPSLHTIVMPANKTETFMKLFAQVNLNSVSSMETEAIGVVYLFLCKMPCM